MRLCGGWSKHKLFFIHIQKGFSGSSFSKVSHFLKSNSFFKMLYYFHLKNIILLLFSPSKQHKITQYNTNTCETVKGKNYSTVYINNACVCVLLFSTLVCTQKYLYTYTLLYVYFCSKKFQHFLQTIKKNS